MKVRLLADDLTGALDSAAAFAGEVPVYLDAPPADDDAPTSAVATATRDVPAADLPGLLAPSLPWLCAADVAFKKVDSLLRGNTFAECAHLAKQGGFARVVFAPAYPAQGRLTLDGRAWVRGADGALQPIVPTRLADAFAAHGLPAPWVPDVRGDDDLRAIAAASLHDSARGWLLCGSAGLADALARALGLEPTVRPAPAAAAPLWLVSASHHAVTRRQWARLRERFEDTPALRLHDLSPAERLQPVDAAALLARQSAEFASNDARPATLVVVGGDTLRALCRASGATALVAMPAPRNGWGRARIVGGRWDGVPVYSRSGAFGGDDDLRGMIAALTGTR